MSIPPVPDEPRDRARDAADQSYLAPAIVILGTLESLTRGGIDGGPNDGFGTAGTPEGSI